MTIASRSRATAALAGWFVLAVLLSGLSAAQDLGETTNLRGTVLCGSYRLEFSSRARDNLNEEDIRKRFTTFLGSIFNDEVLPIDLDRSDDCVKKPRHVQAVLYVGFVNPDARGQFHYDVTLYAQNSAIPTYPQPVDIWSNTNFGNSVTTGAARDDLLLDVISSVFTRFLDSWKNANPGGAR